MLSVTTSSAVIVIVPLNVPAASGVNVISITPLEVEAMLNAASPVNSTATLFAFSTE